MPWHIGKRDGEFCVIKDGDGDVEGCHETRVQAERQLAALYASEVGRQIKGGEGGHMGDLEKAVWTTRYVNDLPDSSFLHVLSGGEKDGEGKTVPRSLRMFPYKDANGAVDLPHLRNALARIPQSDRINAATKRQLTTKARGILQEQQKEMVGWLERIALKVKSWFAEPEPEPQLMLWKEADGRTRWLGLPTNSYRDDDYPPEILSEAAHRDFVKAVDSGEWPWPELWIWHVPGTRIGVTDFLVFDEDSGFLIASGTIDPGKEAVAQKCVELHDLMSHGMPPGEIHRDDEDGSILTRYRSKEFSSLPAIAAANKGARFLGLVKEGDSMKIPEHKLEGLAERGIDVDALMAALDEAQGEAEAEGRERKEKDAEAPIEAVEMGDEAPANEVEVTEPEPDVAEAEPVVFDQQAFAAELGAGVREAMGELLAPVTERLEALEAGLKELGERQVEQAKQLELTPAAAAPTMAQIIKSAVIGQPRAQIDGRSAEAKDTPREVKADAPVRTGIELIDGMMAGRDWREFVNAPEQ